VPANRTQLTPAAGGVAYNPGDLFHIPPQGGFGPRSRDNHVGIDYTAKVGTSIPAASTGEVVYSGPSGGFHHAVVVKSMAQDGGIYYSTYGHVDPQSALRPGSKVSAGEEIGKVGTVHPDEGEKSDGPHLHFGITTQDAIDDYNHDNGTHISVAPNGGESGGIGFRTGQTDLFVNPDQFTGYADGAPYNARTYVPIRDGLTPRPIPYLAQSQEANGLISERNLVNRAGISPEELSRF
jgi:murein DD-endopeptidase MepM/ murein hydrolase activator NlpD